MSTDNSQQASLLPPPNNPKARYQGTSSGSSNRPELDKAAFRLTMTEDDFKGVDDAQLTPASESPSSPPRTPMFGIFDAKHTSFFGMKRKQSKPSVLEQPSITVEPVPTSTLRPNPVNYDAALRISVGSPLAVEKMLQEVDGNRLQVVLQAPRESEESHESHYSAIEYSQEFAAQTAAMSDDSDDDDAHSKLLSGHSSNSNIAQEVNPRARPTANAVAALEITEEPPLLRMRRGNMNHSKIDLMRLRPTHWCFVSRNFTQNDAATFLPWAIPATGMVTVDPLYATNTEHPFTLGMLEDLKKANQFIPLFAHTLVVDTNMMTRIHKDLRASTDNHLLK
jgi:hypothetical protein